VAAHPMSLPTLAGSGLNVGCVAPERAGTFR
jgi:hypothetical protein